jgi:uncharacterized membrane protein YhaH (DUF805 family)
MDWYLMVWKKYADFTGRSRRKEYWMFALFNCLISLVAIVLGVLIGISFGLSTDNGLGATTGIRIAAGLAFLLLFIYFLAAFVPSLAVSVRRFHDTGKSGWLLLLLMVLTIIPILGLVAAVIEIIFLCTDSDPQGNQYGPNPKFLIAAPGVFAGNAGFCSTGVRAQSQPEPAFAGASHFGFCKRCGAKLADASPFCGNCGVHI